DLLTAEETADLLRISASTVRQLCRSKKLPAVHYGKQWRIVTERLLSDIEGREGKDAIQQRACGTSTKELAR
ncbi:MAG: helix-turn-helix domain-containing protein, partial [Raoultibacter sp.]